MFGESIRGKDLFIMVDVCNYSLTYTVNGHINHMSPDDHYQDLKRIISASTGKAHRVNVIMPFLYESRQHKRTKRESLDCAMALEELTAMGDICVKHGVTVVSDEIHNDFVFRGEHTVFASIKKEFEDICVVCTSPSKTFNLASMMISNIFVPNKELRQKFQHQVDAAGISQLGVLGLVAAQTAYEKGDEWYESMLAYVWENIAYVKKYVKDNMPGVNVIDGEGTYLLWLDFRGTGIDADELDRRIIYDAKLWLDSGKIFGKTGTGFQRINVAAPRKTIEECMKRIEGILK